jgi:hypothetical protein
VRVAGAAHAAGKFHASGQGWARRADRACCRWWPPSRACAGTAGCPAASTAARASTQRTNPCLRGTRLMVDCPALVTPFVRHSAVAVVPPVGKHDLLHLGAQLHLLGRRFLLLPMTVKPRPA